MPRLKQGQARKRPARIAGRRGYFLRLTPEQYTGVQLYATRKNWTKAQFIRMAIVRALEEEEAGGA